MWAGRKGSNLKEKCCWWELYISGDGLFSWFQCPCCSGQDPSSPDLPSGWLRERQDISTTHREHGKRQSQAPGSVICYKAMWHPGCRQLQPSLRIKGNERDFTSKPSPAGEDRLWMHFERKENENFMLEICMWEKDKREFTVKQNAPKNLLPVAKICYQNVN